MVIATRPSTRRKLWAFILIVALAALLALPGAMPAQAQSSAAAIYHSPLFTPYKVTVDSAQLQPSSAATPATEPEQEHRPALPPPARRPVPDPVIQVKGADQSQPPAADAAFTAPIINVAGITSTLSPPDTVGDIGTNHYVQMTNAAFASGETGYQVFNKHDGSPATDVLRFGGLWPEQDGCNRGELGDPIVVFDHLADRWLLSQMALDQAGEYMCVAISQTADPTAHSWFLYSFKTPDKLPDYPKFGVWSDGYYMSSFEQAATPRNLGIYVFNRAHMLAGIPASFFQTILSEMGTSSIPGTRILPADLDGPAPPVGAPGYFVRPVDGQQDPSNPTDRIEVYEFRADWATPANSIFTLVDTLTPAPFQIMFCNRSGVPDFRNPLRDCIPQPGEIDTLDALSARPMMQLKYRNFGAYQAMAFNQTIDVSGSINAALGFTPAHEVAGVRWYELRKSGARWGIHQQGTYAPQPAGATTEAQLLHRWMGSMAMDRAGNIALGYSVVNSDNAEEVYPGIRYTGRLASDQAGVMAQAEQIIVDGINSQGNGDAIVHPQRWGDYSALSVDPVDNCTFWYTTHVAGEGGTGSRPTRIAAFRVPSCILGLQLVTATSGPGSNATQSATASCPSGKQVIGAGGSIIASDNRVVLRGIVPNQIQERVIAVGAETGNGTPEIWRVHAFAICANASALPGYQVVVRTSTSNSTSTRSIQAICPSGTKLLGVGGALAGPTDRLVLQTMAPNGGRTGAVAFAAEAGSGTTSNWSVTAYAICAGGVPGYQVVTQSSPSSSISGQSATVACPSGMKVLSAGGSLNGQAGNIALVDASPMLLSLNQARAEGQEVNGGLTTDWSATAYAICATP